MDEQTRSLLTFLGIFVAYGMCWMGVGYFSYDIIHGKTLGFYASGWEAEEVIKEVKEEKGYTGDWVCIDISKDNIKDSQRVIDHEIAHHIYKQLCGSNRVSCMGFIDGEDFAEYCEEDLTKCMELLY